MFGWRWYWAGQEKKISSEHAQLLRQISAYAESEVIVRKLDSRLKSAQDFWTSRGKAADSAASVLDEGITVTGWEYFANEEGIRQTVSVSAGEKEKIISLVTKLAALFPQVSYEEIKWTDKDGWQSEVMLGGSL